MHSYAHFRSNAGRGGLIRTTIFGLLGLACTIVPPIVNPSLWPLPVAGLVGLLLPLPLRPLLVARPERTAQVLRLVAFGFLALPLLRHEIERGGPWAWAVPVFVGTAYLGAYVLFLSDHRVVVLDERPGPT